MNEIDRIWSYSAEELLARPKDVDAIIAHYRVMMGKVDSGQKPKKGAEGIDLKLEDIMDLPKEKPFTRRFG
jgi:hypothetical protein